MKPPFYPVSSAATRALLRGFHLRDYECVPGIVLRLLLGLTGVEAVAANWGHLSVADKRFQIPSRGIEIQVNGATIAWLLLYRFDGINLSDPISNLPPCVWAGRFRRLAPKIPINHLRRSYLFYRTIDRRRLLGMKPLPISPDPRFEILALALMFPYRFDPPIEAPVRRPVVAAPTATPPALSISEIDLV